jgi:signal transduction histidine kinase
MHRLRSVRVRSTLSAALVVLVALVIAGISLVGVLRDTQIRTIDNALRLRAIDIESLLDGGAAPSTVTIESDEDSFVQIVDDQGRVIAASSNVAGQARLAPDGAPSFGSRVVAILGGEHYRVHSSRTDGAVNVTIVVGTTLEDVNKLVSVVGAALAVGVPLLLVMIASMVWIVVGRALRPVEAIRAEVADIGGRELDRRVPMPASQDEIGRLAATMNEMLDRLEESHHKQTEFVSNASHELRTPIAVIRHELEVALRTDDAEELRAAARDVLEEDLRMQRLVDDLLFMARHERPSALTAPTVQSAIDLDDLVLAEMRRQPVNKTIDISGVSAGQVRGNEDHLRRVVRNLLDNALRHAASGVAVHVSSGDGHVRLDVDDDGPGVRDDLRETIFERFARGDDARSRDEGGAGLGLAIVSEIVREHGGTVSVVRSPWLGGARFTVTLPDARS